MIDPDRVAEALGAEIVTEANTTPRIEMYKRIRKELWEAGMPGKWRLMGYDTFSSEWYEIRADNGRTVKYQTKELAEAAAKQRLAKLERSQPTSSSGGQGGIQDKVFIVGDDGERYNAAGLAWNAGDITDRIIADVYPTTPSSQIANYEKLRATILTAIVAKDREIAQRDRMLVELAKRDHIKGT